MQSDSEYSDGEENTPWNEQRIKEHYRDAYRYDPVRQYRDGNRFEKLWFTQRIKRISQRIRKMDFTANGNVKGRYWMLDVGGGTGAISREINDRFLAVHTLVTDISPWCIKKAWSYHNGQKRIHFSVADGFNLPLKDQTVFVVLLTEVLEHLKEPAKMLKEASRVLVDGGLMVITVPNKYHPIWHLDIIRKAFSSGYGKDPGRYEPFHSSFSKGEIKEMAEPYGLRLDSQSYAGMGITLIMFFIKET